MSTQLDNLLASVLRGDSTAGTALVGWDADAICVRAAQHGILPLVAHQLVGREDVSPELQAALRQAATQELAADVLREHEIRVALAALAAKGIEALLMKGAQLAYGWYERPDLRPRVDTDVLVPAVSRHDVDEILKGLGYEIPGHSSGELLTYQVAYVKQHEGLVLHTIDVHWRVANPQVFAGVLPYDELVQTAVAVPALGPSARALSGVDALLLACVHRVAHHFDANRLIWLYDIHLIASQLSSAEWDVFLDLVNRRNVGTVCRRSLDQTVRRFHTTIPHNVRVDARLCAPARHEATAAYVTPRRHVHNVMDDLLALATWRERMRLVREHLFPSRQYMREVYAVSSRAPLPFLYARRAVRGAWRWLDRAPVNDDAAEIR